MSNPLSDETPQNDFAVVGENRNDPSTLLVMGADGNYYALSLPDGETTEIEPDDEWEIEPAPPEELFP
jgi:hypothetical protein